MNWLKAWVRGWRLLIQVLSCWRKQISFLMNRIEDLELRIVRTFELSWVKLSQARSSEELESGNIFCSCHQTHQPWSTQNPISKHLTTHTYHNPFTYSSRLSLYWTSLSSTSWINGYLSPYAWYVCDWPDHYNTTVLKKIKWREPTLYSV